MYLPLHYGSKGKYLFRLKVNKLAFFTVSLPLFAFITCIVLTMYKDFESANHTHCQVPNIFPSISAAIGNYEPQTTIWKTAIYVHAPIRFYLVYLRWNCYKSLLREDCIFIINIAVLLNVIENLSLVGLTYWTSSLNYPNHERCFKTFIGTSIFYMLFVCLMLTRCRRKVNATPLERYSVKLKWRTLIVNVVSFAFAAYFFLRHNSVCEPYVYSLFGFSEYIVVISNIFFHLTTIYDVQVQFVYLSIHGIRPQLDWMSATSGAVAAWLCML